MKKTIVIADRDESLQHAFMTVFSREAFEIIYASSGKEVEKIAERIQPDVYIVNVSLPKLNGIEVYKKLQKQKFLETASFFFLKDENDKTELLGYQADGVLEKPLNFFRVYEAVTKEDEIIELTDLIDDRPDLIRKTPEKTVREVMEPDARPVEEGPESAKRVFGVEPIAEPVTETRQAEPVREEPQTAATQPEGTEGPETKHDVPVEKEAEPEPKGSATGKEGGEQQSFEDRLKDAMDSLAGGISMTGQPEHLPTMNETGEEPMELEAQFKMVLNQAMEEAALKLSAKLAPILTQYVEDYVKRMLLEIAEKVIREEIDKLLKESAG
jgi:CheY-like chemotaxis protein